MILKRPNAYNSSSYLIFSPLKGLSPGRAQLCRKARARAMDRDHCKAT